MRIFRGKRNGYRFYGLVSCTLIVLLLGIIPIRLAIAYYQVPYPQVIFTLALVVVWNEKNLPLNLPKLIPH